MALAGFHLHFQLGFLLVVVQYGTVVVAYVACKSTTTPVNLIQLGQPQSPRIEVD